MDIYDSALGLLDILARAGGGGSGGGGGGGAGGGIGAFTLLGYGLAYIIVKPAKKLLPHETAAKFTLITGIIFTILIILSMFFVWNLIYIIAAIEVIIGGWLCRSAVIYDFWGKARNLVKKADQDIAKAGWSEEKLQQLAISTFMRYQADWSNRDSSKLHEYATENYVSHASLMIRIMEELGRHNIVENPEIINIDTSRIHDDTDDNKDTFSVFIEAKATDILLDDATQKKLYVDKNPFIEEWTFRRSGATWLLDNIRQATEDPLSLERSLKQFAESHNMFYSLDMGWLFLPSGGELFKKNVFGKSDINNHVVGLYKNKLVQLYSYVTDVTDESTRHYLIGQINLPKSYGGILIERKKGLTGRLFKPKGYEEYSFEWPDFNDRYKVYATDQSRLATFELLNPGFMAFLYDNFNNVNIEVVNNSVFFYSEDEGFGVNRKINNETDYEKLLTLLLKAFKELKL